MAESWQVPVAAPLFTDALLAEWIERARTEARKAKAFDTRLRFSGAGACSRALAYEALGCEPTQPMDPAGLWVTGLGTMIHELLQEAISRRYPNASFEVKGQVGDISGHCDAVVQLADKRMLFELKTTGAFAFDKAVGLKRKAYRLESPEGPRRSAVLQAGLNAIAHQCTTLVIGYIAMEAVSVQLAAKTGMRQLDRVMAEWHIPESVWRPMAEAELDRQEAVLATVDGGFLPTAFAVDDSGALVGLDPAASKPAWQCNYCRFRDRCEDDGPGLVKIKEGDREGHLVGER